MVVGHETSSYKHQQFDEFAQRPQSLFCYETE